MPGLYRHFVLCICVAATSAASSIRTVQHADDHFVRRGIFRREMQQQQQQQQTEQSTVRNYYLYEPYEIPLILQNWTRLYGDFVQLTTAQEAYGLPPIGTSEDCPFDGGNGCLIYIMTLQDYQMHPVGSESSKQLPEVLLNGQVHGDERVGPTAVLEATHLLLMAAACETQNTMACRDDLLVNQGIDNEHRQWLARLLRTRRIVLTATANPWGYYRNVRTEYDIDVNRDFAFDAEDATTCMQSISARAINELVREHMFQSGIVFHAGFEMIGYEWGANEYNGWRSPDDSSQSQIAEAQSRYGGGWSESPPYIYGTMDQVIYTVQGSLEDWGYASSWDTDVVTQCEPTTYGGYDAEKTVYPPYTNRMFSMLVETSMDKTPTSNIGNSMDVLNPDSSGNGHVPRNVRLSLLMVDLVEPYVWFTNDDNSSGAGVNTMVPVQSDGTSCRTNAMLGVEQTAANAFTVSWQVGGAFQVDETDLWYAKWEDVPETALDCQTQPTRANVQQYMQRGTLTGLLSGTGRFSSNGSTVFEGTIPLSDFQNGDMIVILASARVDSSWTDAASSAVLRPQLPPQSHLANIRTNPDYYYETETNIVRGRLDWFSQPLTLQVISSSSTNNAPTVSPGRGESPSSPEQPLGMNDTLLPTMQRTETQTSRSTHQVALPLLSLLLGIPLIYFV